MADFRCPECGAELPDRDTTEDAQFDHDLYEPNCNGQVEPI